ncbi:uncharacterized protein [Argopecten irradians]|uniref:uncharacterized protein n=1 Tax=Argopecten irradians TaxID=31199 RepID=UPI0037248893
MDTGHRNIAKFAVLVLVLSRCEVSLGQNVTYVGHNITTGTPNPLSGQKTVILTGINLPSGWLTGFLVTTDANCIFQLQLWTGVGQQDYTLLYSTEDLSFSSSGQYQVDLGLGKAVTMTGSEILGFTAIGLEECITFNSIINPRSDSMVSFFSLAPTVNNNYTFTSYQDTNHYGIMAIIQDTEPPSSALFGFNNTGAEVLLSSASGFGVMLRDIPLTFGRLLAYYVNILGNDCQVYFQLWKTINTTTMNYRMKHTTTMQNFTENGYYKVDVPDMMIVTVDDRIVFVDVSPSPCVVFEFTPNPTRFSASGSADFRSGIATPGTEKIFQHFQVTHRFSVMVQVDGIIPRSVTGVTGAVGAQGNTGPEGVTGLAGETGTTGSLGPTGNTGQAGAFGDLGVTGSTGLVGPTGSQGLQGVTGPQGLTGTNGDIGVAGSVGAQGPQGYTGVQGLQGITGSEGKRGDKGDVGDAGSTGVNGLPGTTGATGTPGKSGSNGLPGDVGATGSEGDEGDTGVAGPTGIQGPVWDPFDVNHCAQNTGSCDHGCINTAVGYTCTCRTGFKLLSNGDCQDIDECVTKNGGCQYFCTNSAGSYACSCPQGYALAKDEHRCDDINECLTNNGDCATDQLCINTWDGRVCVGPYTLTTASGIASEDLLTNSMFVGLIIWMAVITFIMLLEVVMLLPEFNQRSRRMEAPQSTAQSVIIEEPSTEFFFPAFFPRVRLGIRDYYSNPRSETTEKRIRM